MKPLNKFFDHTLLKADATKEQISNLCREAKEYDFYSVCVNSCYVEYAASKLKGSDVKIAAVVGFPLGACTTKTKAFEAEEACREGASEIDMVINIGAMKSEAYNYIENEIIAVVDMASDYGAIVKVILETCLLTDNEIIAACKMAKKCGAAFVKTSTGFSTAGATERHVKLMRETVGDYMGIKASGGIRDYETVMKMIDAGASRIGASASVDIIKSIK